MGVNTMSRHPSDLDQRTPDSDTDHVALFEQGVETFSKLFTRWMDSNGWSHPVIVSLAKNALHGSGWLHSSQVSGLRHGKLRSPGPRTFVAIERLNWYLHRYKTQKLLIPGTTSSNNYQDPEVILDDDGNPPALGWWIEVFCGFRTPSHLDNAEFFFTPDQALQFSIGFGRLARRLLAINSLDIVTDIDIAIHRHYVPGDTVRVGKLKEVLLAQGSWTPDELQIELPSLARFTDALGGPDSEKTLVNELL